MAASVSSGRRGASAWRSRWRFMAGPSSSGSMRLLLGRQFAGRAKTTTRIVQGSASLGMVRLGTKEVGTPAPVPIALYPDIALCWCYFLILRREPEKFGREEACGRSDTTGAMATTPGNTRPTAVG